MQIAELIEVLEAEYWNDITLLKGKSPQEVAAAIAQQEMIAHIKMLEEASNAK